VNLIHGIVFAFDDNDSAGLFMYLADKFPALNYGRPITCTWAYGEPAHMMYAPVSLCTTGSPVVLGSKGHMIIQCGPTVIGGLVRS